jgi:hypothetical protein
VFTGTLIAAATAGGSPRRYGASRHRLEFTAPSVSLRLVNKNRSRFGEVLLQALPRQPAKEGHPILRAEILRVPRRPRLLAIRNLTSRVRTDLATSRQIVSPLKSSKRPTHTIVSAVPAAVFCVDS